MERSAEGRLVVDAGRGAQWVARGPPPPALRLPAPLSVGMAAARCAAPSCPGQRPGRLSCGCAGAVAACRAVRVYQSRQGAEASGAELVRGRVDDAVCGALLKAHFQADTHPSWSVVEAVTQLRRSGSARVVCVCGGGGGGDTAPPSCRSSPMGVGGLQYMFMSCMHWAPPNQYIWGTSGGKLEKFSGRAMWATPSWERGTTNLHY